MKTSIILLRCDINDDLYQLTKNAAATLNADEKIMVDNNSTVDVCDWFSDWRDILIKNKTNIGYPAAVNQGFKLASGDLIAVANNDIRVMGNWREVAEEIFTSDPKVGSVHYRMVDYDGPPTQAGYNTWTTGKERWCSSSFFVIRKEAKQMYDENYKEGGYDDWDYWHRVRHIFGWKTAYTTKSCYQHKHSSTYIALDSGDRSERDKRNREYFKSKFGKYAEDIWNEKYPDQMREDYYGFFDQL